jgi:hypothetical protein
MPRDKKAIHRATSDVEDEVISDEEPIAKEKQYKSDVSDKLKKSEDPIDLTEERKKHLKNAILKRTFTLRQQRERDRQQRVGSTQKY